MDSSVVLELLALHSLSVHVRLSKVWYSVNESIEVLLVICALVRIDLGVSKVDSLKIEDVEGEAVLVHEGKGLHVIVISGLKLGVSH